MSFAAFVLVLGSVSLLIFMKSLDFNFENLTSSGETTAAVNGETTTAAPVEMTGKSNVLFICGKSDGTLLFSFLIKSDMSVSEIKAYGISGDAVSPANNTTASLDEHYQKFGAAGFVNAVSALYGVQTDGYISVNETQFKSFVSKTGDVTVSVSSAVNENGLTLDAGEQSLSGDLLLRYLQYSEGDERTNAFCRYLETVFSEKNVSSADSLFSYLANNSETDISIVDYTNRKDEIAAFISSGGKISAAGDISNAVNE